MAKLIIKRDELKKGMQKTSKIASSSSNLDHMRAYYFVITEGKLTLASSDLKLTLFAKVPVVIEGEIDVFAVDSRRLDELVKLSEEEIVFEPVGNEVKIRTGSYSTSWAMKNTEMFEHDVSEGEWTEEWVASEFKYVIESLLAVSDKTHVINESDNNIYLDTSRAFCFDGANLAFVPFKTADKFVITNSIGKQLRLLAEGGKMKVKRISGGSIVVIETDNDLFSFRDPIYEQGYDVDRITENLDEQAVIAITKETFLRSLKRMALTGEDDLEAELVIEDQNNALLTLKTYVQGEQSVDELKIKRAKPTKLSTIRFGCNLSDLIMLTSSVRSEIVRLYFFASPVAGTLLSVQDEGKRFIGYLSYEEA
jgi:DNA polymerase III sliding clamp (beta) subunit (PCNA family)